MVRTAADQPTDARLWSTRDLAAGSGMSASSVGLDLEGARAQAVGRVIRRRAATLC